MIFGEMIMGPPTKRETRRIRGKRTLRRVKISKQEVAGRKRGSSDRRTFRDEAWVYFDMRISKAWRERNKRKEGGGEREWEREGKKDEEPQQEIRPLNIAARSAWNWPQHPARLNSSLMNNYWIPPLSLPIRTKRTPVDEIWCSPLQLGEESRDACLRGMI